MLLPLVLRGNGSSQWRHVLQRAAPRGGVREPPFLEGSRRCLLVLFSEVNSEGCQSAFLLGEHTTLQKHNEASTQVDATNRVFLTGYPFNPIGFHVRRL